MPVKHIAAMDLGSNSFHLIIAEVTENNSFRIIDRRREVIRIGLRKIITEEEIDQSILILKTFKELADKYNAEITAAATSAVREASNSGDFAERIFRETSVKVEIISGEKEAELIFLGASDALKIKEKSVLFLDVGGGSTEVIFGKKDQIVFAESLKLGSVRLMEKFFPGHILSFEKIETCKDYIHLEISSNFFSVPSVDYDIAAGASGTIISAASTIYFLNHGSYPDQINSLRLDYKDLIKFSQLILSEPTKEKRLLIPGIEEKRADILPAGILILLEIFEFFGIKTLMVSEYGLREGLVKSYLNSRPGYLQ